MTEPEPHDCAPDCHPLLARDGVSPACSDDCQQPLAHGGRCDNPALAERRRDAAWSGRLAAAYGTDRPSPRSYAAGGEAAAQIVEAVAERWPAGDVPGFAATVAAIRDALKTYRADERGDTP